MPVLKVPVSVASFLQASVPSLVATIAWFVAIQLVRPGKLMRPGGAPAKFEIVRIGLPARLLCLWFLHGKWDAVAGGIRDCFVLG